MKRGSNLVPKEQVVDPRFIVACPQMYNMWFRDEINYSD
jgi:hypothetical protein